MLASFGSKAKEEVLQAIRAELSPYVGKLMARTAAEAHCRDLGFHGADLDGDQVAALLKRIQLGLVIFLGRSKTEALVQELSQAIARLGEAN